jgi:seryl-tRNA synthetase
MGDKKREEPDYFNYFKRVYELWEKSASQALELWIKSPLFKNTMEKALEKSTEFRNYIQEVMDRTLKYGYFPMKNDIDKLAEYLSSLEEKLNKLESKINELHSMHDLPRDESSRSGKVKSKARRKKQNG